jgi:hypothetical protein
VSIDHYGCECYVAQSLRPIDGPTMITCNYFCIVAIAVVTWCPRQTYDHPFTWMRKTFVVVRASTVFSTSSHVRSFATMCFLALVLGNYGIFSCRCPLWLQCSRKSSGFFDKFLPVETLEHFFFQFFETFFRSFFLILKKEPGQVSEKLLKPGPSRSLKKLRPSKHWNIRSQKSEMDIILKFTI